MTISFGLAPKQIFCSFLPLNCRSVTVADSLIFNMENSTAGLVCNCDNTSKWRLSLQQLGLVGQLKWRRLGLNTRTQCRVVFLGLDQFEMKLLKSPCLPTTCLCQVVCLHPLPTSLSFPPCPYQVLLVHKNNPLHILSFHLKTKTQQ